MQMGFEEGVRERDFSFLLVLPCSVCVRERERERQTLENRELYKACESAVDTMESVGVATKLYGL